MVGKCTRHRCVKAAVALVIAVFSYHANSQERIVAFRNDLTAVERLIVRRLPELRDDKTELAAAFAGKNVWIADVALHDAGNGSKLVLLQTGYWCGSAGCQLLLLERDRRRWRIVTSLNFEVGAKPLRILPESDTGRRRLAWGEQVYIWRDCGYWTHDMLDQPNFDPKKLCD